ncbi:MAG: DUF1667 domain-containing protein [Treponema sp.]
MKEFTCVSCPMGCRLTAIKITDENSSQGYSYSIQGYSCKRGLAYGLQEMQDPRRNISSTVTVRNGFLAVLPVKTSAPIPKNMIFAVMEEINRQQITAPVTTGQCIIANVLNTGADIIAARSMPKKV